jgi:flavin reductase (DIM6/NTAB) family NADH-FMN oxidoreductase RutF
MPLTVSHAFGADHPPVREQTLGDALAWLEARVTQRMECGDHWLIVAEITHGALLDALGTTAMHQRRSGGNY